MSTTPVSSEQGTGLRYNTGKLRYDLVPTYATEQVARVMTKGAEKYAERNWEKGMKWTSVLASLKRHVHAFERGEDFDDETQLHHMAHAAVNCMFLLEYYRIHPQGDDRPHHYLMRRRIGLDIDDVLADWSGHWLRTQTGAEDVPPSECLPQCWHFDRDLNSKLEAHRHDEDFWMALPRLVDPGSLGFEPHCYITSRPTTEAITRKWLLANGFPDRPIHFVKPGESKAQVAKDAGVDSFVDDCFDNFVDLTKNGIHCWLMDHPHNRRYDVGHRRITSLRQLTH